ncbi:MAG: hypothetical protein WD907_05105, partial [Bacilli bacterium]
LSWNVNPEIVNHNRLLTLYEGAIGIKNGFTHEARYTLVGAAQRNERELIAVILKSKNVDTAYEDMTALLDYAFALGVENVNSDPIDPQDRIQDNEKTESTINRDEPAENKLKEDSGLSATGASSTSNIPLFHFVIGVLLLVGVSYGFYTSHKKSSS